MTKSEQLAHARFENAPTTEKEMSPTPDRSPELRSLDQGWFYHRGGIEHGPLARESLAETLRLMPSIEILVWHPSMPDWASPAEAQVRALIYGTVLLHDQQSGLVPLLFSFEGRLGRARFFWFYYIIVTVYTLVGMAVLAYTHVPITSETGTLIRLVLAPPFVWIGLALMVKRLHDIHLSTIHLLWIVPATMAGSVVPPGPSSGVLTAVGGAVQIWLALKRGTPISNQYRRETLLAQTTVVPRNYQKGGWNVWTGLVVLGFGAVALFVLVIPRLQFSGLLRSVSCSRQDILDTVRSTIISDPSEIVALMMLGGRSNIRMTLKDVRTLSYDEPLHGVTCTATVSTVPIDIEQAANKSGGDSTVTYTVQSTDANDGRYVVTILSD